MLRDEIVRSGKVILTVICLFPTLFAKNINT